MGGSAGGIRALCSILRDVPADFPSPILAVIHIAETKSELPALLRRCCKLKVVDPHKPAALRPGHVYVAPANRHLIVRTGCAIPLMGPRENRHRPAVDTLFRSAARAYRRAVVAVIVSGALDDGAAGALAVKSRGGLVIVQDPEEAEVPDMPKSVMRQVQIDHCLTLKQIPVVLAKLATATGAPDLPQVSGKICEDEGESSSELNETEPLAITCPECGGALMQTRDGETTQWRCHVGHRFSLETFSEAHADAVERAVWVALRKLKERQTIHDHLAKDRSISSDMRRRYRENSAAAAHDIR